jgi:Putative metallopeptidase
MGYLVSSPKSLLSSQTCWSAFAVVAVAWSLAAVAPARAAAPTPAPIPPNPQIDIAYVQPGNAALLPVYDLVQRYKVLETLQIFLAPLKLPAGSKLTVKFDQCGGDAIAAHLRGGPVTICYEYIARIQQMVPRSAVGLAVSGGEKFISPEATVLGPVTQAALHEVALAVFDAFDLPIWGRPGDAADRLSAFIMVQFGPDIAWNTIVGTAWFLSGNATDTTTDFSDIRGLVAQRYYTTVCVAYGAEIRGVTIVKNERGEAVASEVGKFAASGAAGSLSASRRQSCPSEYDTISRAFADLFIRQHRVDEALLEQVRNAFDCQKSKAGETESFRKLACAR